MHRRATGGLLVGRASGKALLASPLLTVRSALPFASVSTTLETDHKRRNTNSRCISTHRRRRLNLSLVGPPGSGKGSYGKHFAKALEIPLVTTSDVLRELRPDLVDRMAEGRLIDDTVVGETLLEGLQEIGTEGYILDGFPRTLRQVAMMEDDVWPESLRVGTVVHLRVPDFVCSTKLLGRRACSKCGKSYNVNGVDRDGWKMPPHLPLPGQVCESNKDDKSASVAAAVCDWSVKREDDAPEIVEERLRVYHQNADPILEHIRNIRKTHETYRLLTLTPYHGFDDLPELVETLRRHLGA